MRASRRYTPYLAYPQRETPVVQSRPIPILQGAPVQGALHITQQPQFLPTGHKQATAVVSRAPQLLRAQRPGSAPTAPAQPQIFGAHPERDQRPFPVRQSTGVAYPLPARLGGTYRVPMRRETPVITPRTPPFVQHLGDVYPLAARRGSTRLLGVHREAPPVIPQRLPVVQRARIELRPWQYWLRGDVWATGARKTGTAPPVVVQPARTFEATTRPFTFEATTRTFVFAATYDEQ